MAGHWAITDKLFLENRDLQRLGETRKTLQSRDLKGGRREGGGCRKGSEGQREGGKEGEMWKRENLTRWSERLITSAKMTGLGLRVPSRDASSQACMCSWNRNGSVVMLATIASMNSRQNSSSWVCGVDGRAVVRGVGRASCDERHCHECMARGKQSGAD